MDRYQFLHENFNELYTLCSDAEVYYSKDVSIALTKVRQGLERVVDDLTSGNHIDTRRNLFLDINVLEDKGVIESSICNKMHRLRMVANNAVHNVNVSPEECRECLDLLFEITVWYFSVRCKMKLNS